MAKTKLLLFCTALAALCLYPGAGGPALGKAKDSKALRERVRELYLSQVGVREATGRNDGRQVEAYLRYTGLGPGYAWCAAFVCWVLGEAGVENPCTAWAAGLFPAGRTVWRQGSMQGHEAILPAMVFGIYFPSLKRIAHCGFVDAVAGAQVITVEGNTDADGTREGDGVHRKRRPLRSIYAVADWLPERGRQ